MTSNFEFLKKDFIVIYKMGIAAESYLYSDTNSCLIKIGQIGETIVNLMFSLDKIVPPESDNTHANRIVFLKREGLLPKEIDDILYSLRTSRNKAIHTGYDSIEQAKILLEMAFNLCAWFMQTYGDWGYLPHAFVMPTNKDLDLESVIKDREAQIEELTNKISEITAIKTATVAERSKRAATVAGNLNISEKETRYLIDEQLRKVGWEADSVTLKFSNGTRPQKNRNLAIAEWPTNSSVSVCGYADYAFFVGLKLVGIVEARVLL